MYKVSFSDDRAAVYGSVVMQGSSVEPCLMFALELHRASNVPHKVMVLDSDDCLVVALYSKDASDK